MHDLSCLDLINSDDMPQSYAVLIILKNCVCFDQNIRCFYLNMTLQSMIPAIMQRIQMILKINYLRCAQRSPTGKHNFPRPVFILVPQSRGNTSSVPVACGV